MRWRIRGLAPGRFRQPRKGEEPAAWRQRLVDMLAFRVTGDCLSEESNAAALSIFEAIEKVQDQVLEVGVFVCQLPEANLR